MARSFSIGETEARQRAEDNTYPPAKRAATACLAGGFYLTYQTALYLVYNAQDTWYNRREKVHMEELQCLFIAIYRPSWERTGFR